MATSVSTVLQIDALKARATKYEVRVKPEQGLWIEVRPNGSKSFALRYRFDGAQRKLTLGPVSLADARRRTRDALNDIHDGIDPATRAQAARVAKKVAAREAKVEVEIAKGKAPDNVEKVLEDFIVRHCSKLRSGEAVARSLRRELVPWHGRRMGEISRRDVADLLDGMIDRGVTTQANRVLAYISKSPSAKLRFMNRRLVWSGV